PGGDDHRPADRDDAADCLARQAVLLEVALVAGQEGDEVRPGRVATGEECIRAAAVLGQVLLAPGEGAGPVLDVLGVLDRGREAVVGDDDAYAPAGVAVAEQAVEAEGVLVAVDPGAAVDEEEDGEVLEALGEVEVELVLGRVLVGAIVVNDVLDRLD